MLLKWLNILGSVFYALVSYMIVIVTIKRKQNMCLWVTVVGVLISLIITNILVSKLELLGASIAYLVSMFVLFVMYVICIKLNDKGGLRN